MGGEGLVKPFYVALSDIVKRILESGYGIQTLEKTTGEVMDNLRQRPAGTRNPGSGLDRITADPL